MIYVSSDFHIQHVKILEYCNRPFKDVEEMNKALIKNYNDTAEEGDVCYFLGDWFMGDKSKIPGLIERYHIKPIVILGNHDKGKPEKLIREAGIEVHDSLTIEYEGIKILLEHQPRYDLVESGTIGPNGVYKYQLCGHVHEQWKTYKNLICNVGVDVWDYKPITIAQALSALKGS